MILTIIAYWFAFNALLFAWLAFGRYVNWSDVFKGNTDRRKA